MPDKATAMIECEPEADETPRPRRVSPDISEVLKLIGAMERLVDDTEERHKAVGINRSN